MTPPALLAQVQSNFTLRFLKRPTTKFAQTVALHQTKWPPELKIEKKSLKDIS